MNKEPFGARGLMFIMEFSDACMTPWDLPVYDRFWMAIYQWASRKHFTKYPYLWEMSE